MSKALGEPNTEPKSYTTVFEVYCSSFLSYNEALIANIFEARYRPSCG